MLFCKRDLSFNRFYWPKPPHIVSFTLQHGVWTSTMVIGANWLNFAWGEITALYAKLLIFSGIKYSQPCCWYSLKCTFSRLWILLGGLPHDHESSMSHPRVINESSMSHHNESSMSHHVGWLRDDSGMTHFPWHTATHCNTLHHTATHCNTLQQRDDSFSMSHLPRACF